MAIRGALGCCKAQEEAVVVGAMALGGGAEGAAGLRLGALALGGGKAQEEVEVEVGAVTVWCGQGARC